MTDRGLILRLSADLKRFESNMKKAVSIADGQSSAMERKFSGATRKMSQNAERSADAIGQEMDRLRAKYDPVFAASKRYETALDELNRAQKIGAIDARVHAQSLDRLNTEYGQIATTAKTSAAAIATVDTSSRAATGGMMGLFNMSSRGRTVLQNTTAQVGDMAIQMEMGTDASRILVQQLPQLFGGFGVLGGVLGTVAPLLGVVAAVGIPLAAMFLNIAGDSEEAAEEVKTFADKLAAAEGALARADSAMRAASAGGLEDLRERYGEVTLAVTELADALADIEARSASVKLESVLDDDALTKFSERLADLAGGATGVLLTATAEEIAKAEQMVGEAFGEIQNRQTLGIPLDPGMQENLDVMLEELAAMKGELENVGSLAEKIGPSMETIANVQRLAELFKEARDAGNFAEAADLLSRMRNLAEGLGVELEDGMLDAIVQGESVAREFANRLGQAEGGARGVAAAASAIPGAVGAAADEAARLASNLGGAMAALRSLVPGMQAANRVAASRIAAERATVGQPVERAGALARVDANEDSGAAAYAAIRGGSSSALTEVADFVRAAESGAREIATAQAELDAAEEAFRTAATAGSSSPAATGGGGGAGSRGGGGGGGSGAGRSETSIFDDADRGLATLRDRIAVLGMSAAETARFETQQRLLNAAREQGIALDARDAASGVVVRDLIAQKADAVGQLTSEFEAARLSEDSFREGLEAISTSIGDLIVEGKNLGESFRGVIKGMAKTLISSGLNSLTKNLLGGLGGGGGILGGLFGGSTVASADGNVFEGGQVRRFARGGAFTNSVVARPTMAPQALFGEAGPEAIMPLTRGANGKLGVQSSGGGSQAVHVTVGVSVDSNGNLLPFVQNVAQRQVRSDLVAYDRTIPGKINATRANTHERMR